jgi:cytokinin dehydrogenase
MGETRGLSRRDAIRGAAGAAVIGWSATRRSWITAAEASPTDGPSSAGASGVPRLDGTLETDPGVLTGFSTDFGRIVTALPHAVLRPGSVADIATMVGFARRHGLSIAVNGQGSTAGPAESHSNYGQALVEGGIAIDAKGLSSIHRVGDAEADVDAGVTWSELVTAAAGVGRTPPVLPDFLHLSVGGTLSVGGIGGTMQRNGAVVDTVRELDVVTGRGQVVTCSPRRSAGLFNAVLAGAGQVGLIVRARVALAPVAQRALVLNLFYDDPATFLADQLTVMADGRFSYQEGQLVPSSDGAGWGYMIEAGVYYRPPDVPDQDALLTGLSDDRARLVATDQTYLDWVHRIDPVVVALRGAGLWEQPKPWLTAFVPAERAADFLTHVGDLLSPADLGAGLALAYPFRTDTLRRPLFQVPASAEAFALSLLRFPFPGADVDALLAQNRTIHDLAVGLGGKRYVIGAVPGMTRADWRVHFGDDWLRFAAAKRWYDPDGVLTPGQGIFG